ncbi:MAG: dihydrolipoamide acyltransferase [Clostridiales bacterium]|nr:MAG: dihydrolipoamide acyltransferase [Clostridiales bacterium]
MYKFKFADVGEGIHEGVVFEWYVKEGDVVKEEQEIYSVETDKFTTDITTPVAGTIKKIYFPAGSDIRVGDVMVDIDDGSGDSEEPAAAQPEVVAETPAQEKIEVEDLLEAPFCPSAAVVGNIIASDEIIESFDTQETKKEVRKKSLATPVARNFAKINGIDINTVTGTGTNGRVMKEDIQKVIDAKNSTQAPAQTATPQAQETKAAAPLHAPAINDSRVERVKMSKMREAISKNMTKSKFTIPHTTCMFEFDVTELSDLRKEINESLKDQGIKLSYLPFVVKALVSALKKHPIMNSELDEVNREIILKKFYNIGIAVDAEHGLSVPVLKDADRMSLIEIHEAIKDLADKAHKKSLSMDEMSGGSFTITNYGTIGGMFATPVINYPESGILGTGVIYKKPVYDKNDRIVPRYYMPVVLSFDHRTIDGGDANRFIADFGKILSSRANLLIN